MSKAIRYHSLLAVFVLLVFNMSTASAQTTEFTYQGKLNDGAMPANAGDRELEESLLGFAPCRFSSLN